MMTVGLWSEDMPQIRTDGIGYQHMPREMMNGLWFEDSLEEETGVGVETSNLVLGYLPVFTAVAGALGVAMISRMSCACVCRC